MASLLRYQEDAIARDGGLHSRTPFLRSPRAVLDDLTSEASTAAVMDDSCTNAQSAVTTTTAIAHAEVEVSNLRARLYQAERRLAELLQQQSSACDTTNTQKPLSHQRAEGNGLSRRLHKDAMQIVHEFLPTADVATTFRIGRGDFLASRSSTFPRLAVTIRNHRQLDSLLQSPLRTQVRSLVLHDGFERLSQLTSRICELERLHSLELVDYLAVDQRLGGVDFAPTSHAVTIPPSLRALTLRCTGEIYDPPFENKLYASEHRLERRAREASACEHLSRTLDRVTSRPRQSDRIGLTSLSLHSPSFSRSDDDDAGRREDMKQLDLKPLLGMAATLTSVHIHLPARSLSQRQADVLAQLPHLADLRTMTLTRGGRKARPMVAPSPSVRSDPPVRA